MLRSSADSTGPSCCRQGASALDSGPSPSGVQVTATSPTSTPSTLSTRLGELGYGVDSLHDAAAPRRAVAEAEAVFVGGGNTFRLLSELYATGALEAIRHRVLAGEMPYVGTSAGTNVACPTIRTTNDMPIVEPPPSRPWGWCRSRSTPTTWTRTPAPPTRGRPGNSASGSSWRRTTCRCWACGRAPCYASRTAPASSTAPPPPASSAAARSPRSVFFWIATI